MSLRTLLQAARVAQVLTACTAVTPTPVPDALRPGAGATLAMTASAIGTHDAGPFWQASDGSRVVASVTTRADAPVAGAIPWLLLAARPDNDTHGTNGLLTGITHIQRVNTAGGSAPAGACQSPGQPLRVPYVADYHFYRSQP